MLVSWAIFVKLHKETKGELPGKQKERNKHNQTLAL